MFTTNLVSISQLMKRRNKDTFEEIFCKSIEAVLEDNVYKLMFLKAK